MAAETTGDEAEERGLSRRRLYAALGAFLGLGAPLGYLALRIALTRRAPSWRSVRRELLERPETYGYLAGSTTAVFAAFGRALGGLEDERRRRLGAEATLREEFTALVSHDMRDPLQAILLETQRLLEAGEGTGEVRAPVVSLRRIESCARRLADVTDDFQDAMQIDLHRVAIQPRPVAVPEAVAALVGRLRGELAPHPIALRVEGHPPPALVDPARLDQILRNLIENAARYSWERAPIAVIVRADSSMRGGGVSIAVEDQGVGIPPQERPYLFDRVRQARRARARKSGLGVGLYITKGLVEAHGGRIRVESEVGRGSTFEVTLPPVPRSALLAAEAHTLPTAPPAGAAVAAETVRAYMRPSPPAIDRDRPVAEARALLHGGADRFLLIVMEGGVPVGLITERALGGEGGEAEATAGDRMERYPLVVSPDAPVEAAARVMAQQKHEAAIVVEENRPVGILLATDALRAMIGLPGGG